MMAAFPLFERYPRLACVARRALGDFPTPVRSLPKLAKAVGTADLYLKNDGVSARAYGGNKVRKLEFLLADAVEAGARAVVTFGYAGSNHAAATAVYAREVGLQAISMLLLQPNASYVRRNLLVGLAVGAELHEFRTPTALAAATALRLARARVQTGHAAYVIPPGGSSPIGTLGYVNAALELDRQITAGELPEPERIYIPLGSSGSVAGLLIGLAALGHRTRVVAIRVAGARWASAASVQRLFDRTVRLLREKDPSFARLSFPAVQLEVRHDFFGSGYAKFSEEGARALRLAREHEGLSLDGSYTAKTLAALLADAAITPGSGPTLFWNTYNSRDLSSLVAGTDPARLPARLRHYFETPLQPLDHEN